MSSLNWKCRERLCHFIAHLLSWIHYSIFAFTLLIGPHPHLAWCPLWILIFLPSSTVTKSTVWNVLEPSFLLQNMLYLTVLCSHLGALVCFLSMHVPLLLPYGWTIKSHLLLGKTLSMPAQCIGTFPLFFFYFPLGATSSSGQRLLLPLYSGINSGRLGILGSKPNQPHGRHVHYPLYYPSSTRSLSSFVVHNLGALEKHRLCIPQRYAHKLCRLCRLCTTA